MNLCYTVSDYDAATAKLRNKKIPTVAHLILGLPGESREMMLESVKHVCSEDLFGLKLHMLNLVKGSHLAVTHPNYVSFQSIDDYVDTLISCLEIIPPNVVLHRISGDAPRATLISPEWSYEKRTILNTIHKEMALRNTWQGKLIP
jgi:hypothetical protein